MADLEGCFVDTSVLLGGIIELDGADSPQQQLMSAVAEERIVRPRTAWHCCLEFYSVATRLPRELRVAPADAVRLVEEEIMRRFAVHALPRDRRVSFMRTAALDGIIGGRVYDAHIAEIARASGAPIVVTENRRHFTQLLRHGTRVLTSAELLDQLA